MPQLQLPIYPQGVTHITSELAFKEEDGVVTYFNGQMPVFVHDAADVATFRMITSQFCVNGNAKLVEISRAFGVAEISVKRAVKRYREQGPGGFYAERKKRGATVLKPAVVVEVQLELDKGFSTREVAKKFGIKYDTLKKAVSDGRVKKKAQAEQFSSLPEELQPSTKSERSIRDSQAPMGMGASNVLERVYASIGLLGEAEIKFQPSFDVPNAGVLLALPALLVTGLLRHAEKYFRLPKGYYGLKSIFLILAFMALVRLKSIERLRYSAPGEWGKILGLDRIPEVRTMREKIAYLSNRGEPQEWSAELCRQWMQSAAPESIGAFYVDGHVRVYHGHQTKLPRHYVARERLCLRATTDYWVNAIDGQPFFMVNQAVDPGLLQVLEKEIVPRLVDEFPHQPTAKELKAERYLHRFTLIFDREGYSPDFFQRMKEQYRIACISYHKFPENDWPEQEFSTRQVKLPSGQSVQIKLAERGVLLAGRLWAREIRKLTERGHQVSILATDYCSDLAPIAVAMFARWSQENFFKYMREHYSLDRLIDYHTEKIPETTKVVNPQYRCLDSLIRSKNSALNRKLAEFGAANIQQSLDSEEIEPALQKKALLFDEISHLQNEIVSLTRIIHEN